MTDVIEGSPPPRVITDWRDWMNEFPKVAALSMFCIVAWIAYFGVVNGLGIGSYIRDVEIKDSILRLLDNWGEKLIWITAAAVFAIVGKRATEKPEVIRAEGEVKAAVVAAQATATTGTFPVPVTAGEVAEPLTHRESERGE
jgi:hypothetical protein